MADVTKTVEIALKIVGFDTEKITTLTDTFTKLQKSIDGVTKYIDNFKTSLNSIKSPPELTKVVSSLDQLNKIKVPNLSNIANGFDKLGKMNTPDISGFVSELKKFEGIKLPGLNTLVLGLKKLSDVPLAGFNTKINEIEAGLKRLVAIDVTKVTTALQAMSHLNLSQPASETAKLKEKIAELEKSLSDSLPRIKSFGDKVRTVLQFRLISDALVKLKDGISAGINAIIDYDQALKDLQAITGATTLEVAQMGIKILEVASTTKFSASEVAAGMRTIGQAGFSASEAVETMQAVSDLATGTLSDMATTVDLVTTAMRVFQIDATESSVAADVFANAVNKSKLTVDKLRTAMNYIGPIARDSGVSFTELAASMGTLANSGLRASTIGTGLRRVFAELIDPSKKLKAAASAAGIVLNELDPRSTSLSQVISNLGLVVNDAQLAFDLFGKRGAASVLALTDNGSKFNEMLGLVSRTGTAAEMASIQMEGLGVSFKNLKDKLGILAIAVGEMGIADAMKVLIDVSRFVIDVLTKLAGTVFVQFVAKAAFVGASIYALVAAFSALKIALASVAVAKVVAFFAATTVAVKGLLVSMIALNTALIPVYIAITAIAALGAGVFYLLYDGAKDASQEALILADKYDLLEKKLRDYGSATVGLESESGKLKEANLQLRKELLEVSKGYGVVAESAAKVVASIDPLEGKFTDNKIALQEYNEELNKFQQDALVLALQKTGESLDLQTDQVHRWARYVQVTFDQVLMYARAFAGTFYDILNFDFSNIPKRWIKAWKDVQNSKKETDDAMDFSKGIHESIKSFDDLEKKVKTFDMTNLTREQKELDTIYKDLNEKAVKFVQHLRDTGQISLGDTSKNMEKIASDAKLSGLELQAVVAEFGRLKEANADTYSNIIEKWEKDSDPVFLTNLIDGFTALGGVITDADKAALAQIEGQRQLRIDQLNDLKETAKGAKESGADMEKFWGDYYTKEQAILKEATKDRRSLANNEKAQQLINYNIELKNLEKHLAKINETWKYNEEERGKAIAEARAKSLLKIEAIVLDGRYIDPKDQVREYQELLAQRETAYSIHMNKIARKAATGAITEEEANEERLRFDMAFYAESLKLAEDHFNAVDKLDDPVNYTKRLKIKEAAEQKLYQVETKYLENSIKLAKKGQEKILKLDEKTVEEKTKNSDKIKSNKTDLIDKLVNLETKYKSKVEAIHEALQEKLKDIDTKISDNRKSTLNDVLSLTSSTEEKIRNVRKRSMTDIAKQYSDEQAAAKYLAEGKRIIAEAEKEKDLEKLARGTAIIQQAESIASGLKNEQKAVGYLQQALSGLTDAANTKGRLKELELIAKKNKEIADAAKNEAAITKKYEIDVNAAKKANTKKISLENIRHNKEMSNLNAELAVQLKKLKTVYEILQIQNIGMDYSEAISDIDKEVASLEKKLSIIKDIKKENSSQKTFDNLMNSTDTIWEKNENGIRSFTNAATYAGEAIDKAFKPFDDSDNMLEGVSKSFEIVEKESTRLFDNIKEKYKDVSNEVSANIMDINVEADKEEIVPKLKENIENIIDKTVNIIINIPQLSIFNTFKKDWEALKDKTITLTKKIISETETGMATGGRLPGFGGGDKHPILAESGEWIINKFAVKKYGDSFMSMLNNMSLPKFNLGGSISSVPVSNFTSPNVLADFGKVSLDTGKVKFPALVHRDVASELNRHLSKMSLMGSNI